MRFLLLLFLIVVFTQVAKGQIQMEASTKPKIVIGGDHAAYDFKKEIITHVESLGYEVNDLGCNSATEKVRREAQIQVDYPDFGKKVAMEVLKDKDNTRGIVICGTGIGEFKLNSVK